MLHVAPPPVHRAHHAARGRRCGAGRPPRAGHTRPRTQDARAARIDLGCYAVLGGDACAEGAARLVEAIGAGTEVVLADDQAWRDLLYETHPGRCSDRTMRTFSSHRLDPGALSRVAAEVPEGYRVERMDASHAARLDARLTPHALQVFSGPEHFARDGVGYAAVVDGDVVAAATSYAISSARMEVAISTRAEHRGRGLAKAVAARLLLHALDAGLAPEWSASNPVSKRLATSLGYRPAGLCDSILLQSAGIQPSG